MKFIQITNGANKNFYFKYKINFLPFKTSEFETFDPMLQIKRIKERF
jgi:hypothetical protein